MNIGKEMQKSGTLSGFNNAGGKNYIVRYHEMLTEAKEQFVQDLTLFQKELQNSRKLFVTLHKEKLQYKDQIKDLQQAINVMN